METHDLMIALKELKDKLVEMRALLRLDEKKEQIALLTEESSAPHFWKDQTQATKKSRMLSMLNAQADQWDKLKKGADDLLEIAELDEDDQSVNLREDIEIQYGALKKELDDLEFYTLLDGKHDSKNAIVAIHSGSGGTEAQDWAEMLLRMVMRYGEKKGWKITMIDESRGQEAGVKAAIMRVEGDYAYGYLKSEHGTHRLVRISPFDAEKMRHTSFALIEVIPEIEPSEEITIDAKDLRIDTFMSGGAGGQSVNTTYSAVRIVHIPTGITVQCQNERSQMQNKETAMKIVHSKLQKLQEEKKEEERLKLRGEYKSPEWGSQIRSYVLHPYHMVKDIRTRYETSDTDAILKGELDEFVEAYLRWIKKERVTGNG